MDLGFLIKRLVLFMQYREILLEDGQIIIKLSTKEIQATNVFILSLIETMKGLKILNYPINKTLFIVGFLLTNKRMILIDNVCYYQIDTLIIKLLEILDQDLIIKEKDFCLYWNNLVKGQWDKLLYPQKTDFVDLDLNSLNGSLYKTIQNSWFSSTIINPKKKNLLRISLPFYKYLLADGMENEDILLKTRKIKLKLISTQKKLLQSWNNHSRYSYNKAINIINQESISTFDYTNIYNGKIESRSSTCCQYSKLDLRNLITPEECNSRTKWILETPKAVREYAVFEAHKNYKACLTNVSNNNIKKFNLCYKTKKNKSWTIGIPKDSITLYSNTKESSNFSSPSVGIYEGRITNSRFKMTEKINSIDNNCTIHFDGIDYFLCVPYEIKKKKNENSNWFCSLDPGVRKFNVLYCPDDDHHIKIGDRAATRLYEHLLDLDRFISRNHKSTSKKIKDKIIKKRIKIQNLQNELHNKVASYLCNNYQNIFIPKLNKENDMIKRINIVRGKKRQIATTTVRRMVVLAHCKFIEKLKTKASEFSNVNIKIIGEAYSSQRCLSCKRLTKTSNEEFVCQYCNFISDRDILGSTNILLQNW